MSIPPLNLKLAIKLLTQRQVSLTTYLAALGLTGNQQTVEKMVAAFNQANDKALSNYAPIKSNSEIAAANLQQSQDQLEAWTQKYQIEKAKIDFLGSRREELLSSKRGLDTKKKSLESDLNAAQNENSASQNALLQKIDAAKSKLAQETDSSKRAGIQKEINGYVLDLSNKKEMFSVKAADIQQQLKVLASQITGNSNDLKQIESLISSQQQTLDAADKQLAETKLSYSQKQNIKVSAEASLQNFVKANEALFDNANGQNISTFGSQIVASNKFTVSGGWVNQDSYPRTLADINGDGKADIVGFGQDFVYTSISNNVSSFSEAVKSQQQLLTLQELMINQQRLTALQLDLASEDSIKLALQENSIQSYATLLPKVARQMQAESDIWLKALQNNHDLTVKVFNQQQSYSKSFNNLSDYIDKNLANPDSSYSLNQIQLNEAQTAYDILGQRRDTLAKGVSNTENLITLLAERKKQSDELNGKIQHIQNLTKYERENNQLDVVNIKLLEVREYQRQLTDFTQGLTLLQQSNQNILANADKKGAITRSQTGNKYLFTKPASWLEAQAQAQALGGNLVTINDIDEQKWINQTFGTKLRGFWLGLTDKDEEGNWKWISGEPLTYKNWYPGEPNNGGGNEDYTLVWHGGSWNDANGDVIVGLVEINVQALKQKEVALSQTVEQTKSALSNATDSLLSALYSPVLQNYVNLSLKTKSDQTVNNVQTFINQTQSSLTPKLINELAAELLQKIGELENLPSLKSYVQERFNIITRSGVNDQAVKDLESLRLETTYLSSFLLKDPLKVEKYLQEEAQNKRSPSFGSQIVASNKFTVSGGWVNQDSYPRTLADINGDGKADIVGFGQDYVYGSLSLGDGTFAPAQVLTSGFNVGSSWINQNKYPRTLADINGDGKADIVGFGQDFVYVSINNGNGSFGSQIVASNKFTVSGGWVNQDSYPRTLADINGDGKADIVGFGQDYVYGSLSLGDGTFAPAQVLTSGFNVGSSWINQNKYPRTLADINGDGKADIVGFGQDFVYVSINNGNGSFGSQIVASNKFTVSGGWVNQDSYPRTLADINGDGKADIVGFGQDYVYGSLSLGDGTFAPAQVLTSGFNVGSSWINQNKYPRTLADINGDGKADIVGFGQDFVYTSISNSARTKYFPELNDLTTLAKLQQQIADQLTQSQQQLETVKNTITQSQAAANAALSQAAWYEQEAPTFWERSHKQGAIWIEYRTYKQKKWYGRSQTVTEEIRHVDNDWIVWDTYTKQAANLKQYAADLLKGVETKKVEQNTVTTILTQWNSAKSAADDAQVTYDQLLSQLQQLEAQRQLTPENQAQLDTLQKLLPTLKVQLTQAEQEVTNAKAKLAQEEAEFQTSSDAYQNAITDVLRRKANLEIESLRLLQNINEAEKLTKEKTIALDSQIQATTDLKQLVKTQLDAITQKIDGKSIQNDLLSKQTQLQEIIQLLTHKETILIAEQATLTQKQTLLIAQRNVIQNEQKLLVAYLDSPDNDTSNLEALLQDSRSALTEAQRLAQQAEASSQVLTASMEDLSTFLQLQNDKYLTAVKDKQNTLKGILEATELKENYTLLATQKQEELNTLSTQANQKLQEVANAGSKEAKALLDVARNQNFATAAEIYHRDYSDLASDKGGGCAGGLARPEDRIFADHYYDEMIKYRNLQQQAQVQANQFGQIKIEAQKNLDFLSQQQVLASKELADLKASIGNSQNTIDSQQQAFNIAQLRVESLNELRNWTEQTLNQILQVEKLNLAQAKIEQTIAQQRQQGIENSITVQLERDRLAIDRQRAIAAVNLDQLAQISAEDTLQQALNDLRSDIGLTPIADFIQQAEWKADLAGMLVDIDALKQKQQFSPELKALWNETSQSIYNALQAKEAQTIQGNLLKSVDSLMELTNKQNAEVAKLDREQEKYSAILAQSKTDLKGATKALYDEIQKSSILAQEKELLNAKNLEVLYKVGYAQGTGQLSNDLAKQSQQLLTQIIEGRIQERQIRKKAFTNEVIGTTAIVIAIAATILTAGAAAAAAGLIGTAATATASATVFGISTTSLASLASTLSVINSSLSAAQSAYNGDWGGAIFKGAMAITSYQINEMQAGLENANKGLKLVQQGSERFNQLKDSIASFESSLTHLQTFQATAQGIYTTYNAVQSKDNILALLSAIQSIANVTVAQIPYGNTLDKTNLYSNLEKSFITAGQLSVTSYQAIKAVQSGSLQDALKYVAEIAGKISNNFSTELQDTLYSNLRLVINVAQQSENIYKVVTSIDNEKWLDAFKGIWKVSKALRVRPNTDTKSDSNSGSNEQSDPNDQEGKYLDSLWNNKELSLRDKILKDITYLDNSWSDKNLSLWDKIDTFGKHLDRLKDITEKLVKAKTGLSFDEFGNIGSNVKDLYTLIEKDSDMNALLSGIKKILNTWDKEIDETQLKTINKVIDTSNNILLDASKEGGLVAWLSSSNKTLGTWRDNIQDVVDKTLYDPEIISISKNFNILPEQLVINSKGEISFLVSKDIQVPVGISAAKQEAEAIKALTVEKQDDKLLELPDYLKSRVINQLRLEYPTREDWIKAYPVVITNSSTDQSNLISQQNFLSLVYPQPGTISFSSSTYSVNEDGKLINAITLTRINGTDGAISVTLTPSNGTATSPSDYNNSPITVNFANGETSKIVSVPIVDDSIYELNETVSLSLANPSGGAIIGSQKSAVLTIIDNDAKRGAITFNSSAYSVNEDGKAINAITLTRSNGSDGAVSVTLIPSNGTATAPSDFNNAPITVDFANGEISKVVSVPIVDDSIYELNETVNLTLSNPTNGAILGSQKASVLTIIDNDLAYAPKISFANPAKVVEGIDANSIFTVNLSAPSSYPITVNYSTVNGMAIAGSDYTTTQGTLTFSPKEISKTIAVPILNDNLNEPDETFSFNLTNPINATISTSQGTATITDTLTASVTTILPAQAENLTLTGSSNINGTGNALNNIIIGNAGINVLSGGAGSDTLTGGAGADRFLYPNFADSPLAALDRITDLNPTEGDRIALKSLPSSVFNGGVFSNSTLSGAISAAYADANPNLAGNQALGVNQAVFFGWNGGKYVSVNDGLAPFNANTDLVINVTGMTGTLATGALTPTNYFAV